MNAETGALSVRDVFETPSNPSWLALDPTRTHIYAANGLTGGGPGSVSAFAIDAATGRLTLLNTVSSEGSGPAHASVHPSGKYVLVANYDGGISAVLPVRPNGELGPATDVKRHEGKPGAAQPSSAPPGSFAISGHERPHAHMIQSDPSGNFVFAADLARMYLRYAERHGWKIEVLSSSPTGIGGFKDVAERTAFLIDQSGTVRGAWRYEAAEVPDFDELLSAARAL
jgi:6-phosphogluconolactonase (cycloisomerase 2 family)